MARKYFSFRSFHRGTVLFEVLLAAVIAQRRQFLRIALASDHSAEDAQAGVAGGVRDRLIEADVHVNEGLLHVQNVG